MLYPGEVVDGKCHLAIHSPHHTCIHCDPKYFKIYHLAISSEGLIQDRISGQEEDH